MQESSDSKHFSDSSHSDKGLLSQKIPKKIYRKKKIFQDKSAREFSKKWTKKTISQATTEKNLQEKYLHGRNAVIEAIQKGRIQKVLISENTQEDFQKKIKDLCLEYNNNIKEKKKEQKIILLKRHPAFYNRFPTGHQGIVGVQRDIHPILDFEIFINDWQKNNGDFQKLQILALDRLSDPHNLGAICRSAWYFGYDLILLENKYSPPLSATVHKSSAGASLHIPFARVHHLKEALSFLKAIGLQIIGSSLYHKSKIVKDVQFQSSHCLVIGSEEKGIRRMISECCDELVYIPAKNNFDSLNVSVATGILCFAIHNQIKN